MSTLSTQDHVAGLPLWRAFALLGVGFLIAKASSRGRGSAGAPAADDGRTAEQSSGRAEREGGANDLERATGRSWRPSLESIATGATLGGAVIYVALFLVYQAYYGRLGLRPEDAGVSQTFILTRSLGLLALIMVVVIYLLGPVLLAKSQNKQRMTPDELKANARQPFVIMGMLFLIAVSVVGWRWNPHNDSKIALGLVIGFTVGLTTVYALVLSSVTWRARPLETRQAANVALVATCAVLGIIVALVLRAGELGDQAAQGGSVQPLTPAGLPLLDVEAGHVDVEWIGAKEQAPDALAGTGAMCALLVGQGSSVTALVLKRPYDDPALVQVPTSQLTVTARKKAC